MSDNLLAGGKRVELTIRWAWLIAGVLFMVVLSWGNSQPEAAGLIPAPWDKLVHFLIFGALMAMFVLGLGIRRWGWALGIVAGFALYDEWRQLHLPGRHAGVDDLAVDFLAMGVVLFGLLCLKRAGLR